MQLCWLLVPTGRHLPARQLPYLPTLRQASNKTKPDIHPLLTFPNPLVLTNPKATLNPPEPIRQCSCATCQYQVLTSWDDLVKGDIQGCLKMLQNALRHTLNAEAQIPSALGGWPAVPHVALMRGVPFRGTWNRSLGCACRAKGRKWQC